MQAVHHVIRCLNEPINVVRGATVAMSKLHMPVLKKSHGNRMVCEHTDIVLTLVCLNRIPYALEWKISPLDPLKETATIKDEDTRDTL